MQFNEQIDYFTTKLLPLIETNDAALKKSLFHLNTRLLLITFLVDNKPTLADFFVLPALKGLVVGRFCTRSHDQSCAACAVYLGTQRAGTVRQHHSILQSHSES
jgi:hypothetical protein